MTDKQTAYAAGVDAIIADNGLSRTAFADVLQTFTNSFSNAEATDWIDATATRYFELGLASNSNYNQLRNSIIADGAALAKDKFNSLISTIDGLPESQAFDDGLLLKNLRDQRDEVDTSITTMQGFRVGATEQVKTALNVGIDFLRDIKQVLRQQIEAITGDPDS